MSLLKTLGLSPPPKKAAAPRAGEPVRARSGGPAPQAGRTPAAAMPTQSAGTQAGTSRPTRHAKPPVTEYEFEPEEITVPVAKDGTEGDTGPQQIDKLIQAMRDDIQDYWTNYLAGLSSFETSMNFSSEEEAEAKYLKTALKVVAKKAFDLAFDAAISKLGPWGKAVSTAKDVATAFMDEEERAAAAAGGVKIRDYIISIRNNVSKHRSNMLAALDTGKATLQEEYKKLAAGDLSKGKVTEGGALVGDSAGIVNALSAAAKAFHAKIPNESQFQQLFTRNFADTPGRSDYISQGGVPTGKIYFGMSIYIDPTEDPKSPTWKHEGNDDAWKLVTKAPKPDRVADSLKMSLEGKKPWEADLEKMVKIRIELEEPWTNTYMDGWIVFRSSPDTYEVRSNYGLKWFEWAWKNPQIRKIALNNAKLTGGADY